MQWYIDTHSTVLLIGAIYKCSTDHHIIFSTDPQEGLPINTIARHIQSLREEYVSELVVQLANDWNMCTKQELTQSDLSSLTTSAPINLLSRPFPSNDIITRCFVVNFQENQMFYDTEMLNLNVKQCIRLDHTFKVASNIGYLRKDGKWITQYGSIFIVLNDLGQVLTWQHKLYLL